MTTWNGEGPKHRPIYDAENNTPDEATAFNLQDIRGYQTLGHRVGLIAALIVALLIQIGATILANTIEQLLHVDVVWRLTINGVAGGVYGFVVYARIIREFR